MPTIQLHLGSEVETIAFAPTDGSGATVDLTGKRLQLRVSSGAECLMADGEAQGSEMVVDLAPFRVLRPGAHRLSEYWDEGGGHWRHVAEHVLLIEGGC